MLEDIPNSMPPAELVEKFVDALAKGLKSSALRIMEHPNFDADARL